MQAAVFAKNHLLHLQSAAQVGATDSAQLVMFRSSKEWVGARKLLDLKGPGAVPVLFAVVDMVPAIRYRAWLQEVLISPTRDDPRTNQLLLLRPPSTQREDPWASNAKTLYAVSGCHELDMPISYAALLKQKDGQPLSEGFRYSYSLINLIEDDPEVAPTRIAADVTTPPVRTEAIVSRIVRDTRLTRRLKALHDDRCQLCANRLTLPSGEGYSEAHHLQPLGRPHCGPDVEDNVLVLCPNCHALCDLHAVPLERNAFRAISGHRIGDAFLAYHNRLVAGRGTA
jgi:hypothetical protein